MLLDSEPNVPYHADTADVKMDNAELLCNNVLLYKLVSSAEIIFRHLYKCASTDHKKFIDDWFWRKQEYEETFSNQSQFDVNENVQECGPVLDKIDEVSENEKVSSTPSLTSSSDSCVSLESTGLRNIDEALNGLVEEAKTFPKADDESSFIDFELTSYMKEFRTSTDALVDAWLDRFAFDNNDLRKFAYWADNQDYNRIWLDICANTRRNSKSNEYYESEDYRQITNVANADRGFMNYQCSLPPNSYSWDRNPFAFNPPPEIYLDEHIRYLREIHNLLHHAKTNLIEELKKDKLKFNQQSVTLDVALDIIDMSIDLKSNQKLGRRFQDLNYQGDEVYSLVANCLQVLSLIELRQLFISYLSKIIELRKVGASHDEDMRELDDKISQQNILIAMFKSKSSKITSGKTSNESKDESPASVAGPNFLSITATNNSQDSSLSDVCVPDAKEMQSVLSCVPSFPRKSLKILQNSYGSSGGAKVTFDQKKIVITTSKTSNH